MRLLIGVLFAATLFTGSVASAQEATAEPRRRIYRPAGTPAEPKVAARWNRYHDYAQATDLLKKLAAAYPQYAKLQSLGKSYGGREMWVLTITDFEAGKASQKPGFWIDGGIHANEIQAVEVVLYTAWYVLEMREETEFIDNLLKERTLYLMPMLSPDSRDAHFYEPNTTHSPRTGQRPVDDDLDGLVDEDKPNDINGDGHITQMRIRDPNGDWKAHADYPDLMVRVKLGEKGEFRLLGSEGVDDDQDGRVNEDGDGYYDPNRDWGWNWQPSYVQRGAYRYPFSIRENRLVAEFIAKRKNLAGAQSYHNAGGMILRGPGAKTDRFEGADLRVYDRLGKIGEEMLPGYRYMNIAEELYEVYGGEVDWLYQTQGVFTFTNELFTANNYFRKETTGFFGNDEDRYKFNKLLLFGEGVVKWKEHDHPTFGKVEIGGLKKNWQRQPPGFLLEEELHRNMAFTLYHANELPLVGIQAVEAKSLGDELWEVTAILENRRITPTHAAVDVKQRLTPPDLATLQGKDIQVVAALVSDEPLFRRPRDVERSPAEVELSNIPGESVVYVRWIVSGRGPATVTVESVKGGRAQQELTLAAP